MEKFKEVFLITQSLFANLKLMSAFYETHETFLVYKLETFNNCKEVKHIMIMIILFYVIFDQLLKITFGTSSAPLPPKKIHVPLFTHCPPLKI